MATGPAAAFRDRPRLTLKMARMCVPGCVSFSRGFWLRWPEWAAYCGRLRTRSLEPGKGRIEEMTGFGSVGYFIHFFQSRVGETPRKFRVKLMK
jgi:hypothetical protein